MVLKHCSRFAFAMVALPLLAACSETSVMDAFDSGKSPPQQGIAANQPLTVPPDMSLRQPGAANAPGYGSSTTGNGLQVQQGQRGLANRTYQAPPPPQPTQPTWQNQNTAPAPAPQQAYQTPTTPQAPTTNPADAPYIKYGINPYNANGTRKKQSVLNAEARAKKQELERAKNPNYGTVFNSGELWSSN